MIEIFGLFLLLIAAFAAGWYLRDIVGVLPAHDEEEPEPTAEIRARKAA